MKLGNIFQAILLDYSLVSVNPSMAAATSLYLSLCILGMEVEDKILWTQSLHHYTGYTQDQVHEQAHAVAGALKTAHTGKYAAIRQKFSSSVMQRIARNPALESKLRFL